MGTENTLTFVPKRGILPQQARMVELVDTLVSGTSAFSGMEVQVFFRAEKNKTQPKKLLSEVYGLK